MGPTKWTSPLVREDNRWTFPQFDDVRLLQYGMSAGGSLLLLALLGVVTGFLLYRRRDHVEHTIKTDLSPPHIIIRKTDFVKDDLDSAAALQVCALFQLSILYKDQGGH